MSCDGPGGLLRLLPPVLRARDYHLYLAPKKPPGAAPARDSVKNRLVDLWLYGGRALLGHKPRLELRELKNAAERGLLTPLPHPQEGRFLKALGALFPGRRFRVYRDELSLARALEAAGLPYPPLWRPFHPAFPRPFPGAGPLLFFPPHPLAPPVVVLGAGPEAALPPGEILPPAVLAVATRAVYDLIAADSRGAVRFLKIDQALKKPGCPWKREGIYLSVTRGVSGDAWTVLWKRFFDAGFLLPPAPADPLILPGSLSPGEEAKLAAALERAL